MMHNDCMDKSPEQADVVGLTVRVDTEVAERLKAIAKAQHRSVAALLREGVDVILLEEKVPGVLGLLRGLPAVISYIGKTFVEAIGSADSMLSQFFGSDLEPEATLEPPRDVSGSEGDTTE